MKATLFVQRLRWLFVEAWPFWLFLAPVAAGFLFVTLRHVSDVESRLRWMATLLQAFGLLTTVWGIHLTRQLFGKPDILSSASGWMHQWPRRKVAGANLSASASAIASASAALGFAEVKPGLNATVDHRISLIEARLDQTEQRLTGTEQRLSVEVTDRAHEVAQERVARTAEDMRLGERLELTATGGLQLSAIGVTWLILGTFIGGFVQEIAAVAGGTGATRGQSQANHLEVGSVDMDVYIPMVLLIVISLLGAATLLIFWKTKKAGFGPYNTSTLLLLLVVIMTSLLCVAGRLEGQIVTNILFAVVGFAGGMFSGKRSKAGKRTPGSSPQP